MIYLVAHITIGIVLLGTVLVQHYFEKKKSKSTNDLANLLAPTQDEPSLAKRIWKGIIRPVLGGILIVIVWPLVLIFVAIKSFAPSKKKKPSKPIEFAVSTDDLNERLSITEIEKRELTPRFVPRLLGMRSSYKTVLFSTTYGNLFSPRPMKIVAG